MKEDELKVLSDSIAEQLKKGTPIEKAIEYGIYLELRKISESLEKMVKKSND